MQAPTRGSIRDERIRPKLRLELPDAFPAHAQSALGELFDLTSPGDTACGPEEPFSQPESVRVLAGSRGWCIEGAGVAEQGLTDDEALLRLQELLLESAARGENRIVFRGSVVTRGSQSVLIVGDLGSCHAILAVAMTALDFQIVSVGAAAFDARRPAPIPLPLLFRLDAADRDALRLVPGRLEEPIERLTPDLFRPRSVTPARELTHVLFPEAGHSRLSLVRPISSTTARSRLCHALMVAPDDPPPFAAVAEVLRHARGVQVTVGEPPHAIEQLARLLPRWCVE